MKMFVRDGFSHTYRKTIFEIGLYSKASSLDKVLTNWLCVLFYSKKSFLSHSKVVEDGAVRAKRDLTFEVI